MALHVMFMDDISHDMASFYARLAREFGEANWDRAFTPGIPPLMTVLAGPFVLLGIPAFTSLKMVSSILFVFGLWPFRKLMKEILPDPLADWSCLLYAISPPLIQNAGMGLIDLSKTFFLLCSVMSVIEYSKTPKTRWIVTLSLTTFGLSLGRSEGILLLPLFVFWIIFFSFQKPSFRPAGSQNSNQRQPDDSQVHSNARIGKHLNAGVKARLFAHLAIFFLVFSLLCVPQVMYVYKTTSFPALELRQAHMLVRVLKKHGFASNVQIENIMDIGSDASGFARSINNPFTRRNQIKSMKQTLKGLFPPYFAFAILGFCLLLFQKRITRYDLFYLSVIVFNFAIFYLLFPITARYISPTIPFLLGWTTIGISYVFNLPVFKQKKRWVELTAAAIVCAIIWRGTSDLRSSILSENIPKQVGLWIAKNRSQFIKSDPVALESVPSVGIYHNGRQPIIGATLSQYSFWADADQCLIYHKVVYPYDFLMNLLGSQKADLLIADKKFHKCCPEFEAKSKNDPRVGKIVYTLKDEDLKIYQFNFTKTP